MDYLTPQGLREKAPATQKLSKSSDALIDTSAFLRHVAQQGFRPIFAAQGKAHSDVDSPEKGRHFVVAGHPDGACYAILNSHTVYRRAWLGSGFYTGDVFLIGAVVPLPRWRGFEDPLAELVGYAQGLLAAKTALQAWQADTYQDRWLAKKFASTAYLAGHKPASYKAILASSEVRISGYASLIDMMASVMRGGLDAEPKPGFPRRRKVKPLKGPDAIMHAANAAFRTGLDAIRKYHLTDTALNFPSYKRT
jgi:hypothetical protein